jgi:hypothetical protein
LDVGIGSRQHTDPSADRRLDAVWFEHAGSVLQVVPNHSYTKIGHDESLAIAVNGSLLLCHRGHPLRGEVQLVDTFVL